MTYTPTAYVDGSAPALSAVNLNKTEQGVKAAHDLTAAGVGLGLSDAANTVLLLQKLKTGLEDVSVLVVGDSTGNDTTDWVYLTAQTLATRWPTHTVIYHLWDPTGSVAYDTGGSGTPVTLQTGTGARTLHIWNASVAGTSTLYLRGARWAAAVVAPNPDMVFVNYGHNEGSTASGTTALIFRISMLGLTESLAASLPMAQICLVLQNPRGDSNTDQQFKVQVYRQVAALRGYGVLDAMGAFLAQPTLVGLIDVDNIHPTPAGSQVWADEALRHLVFDRDLRPREQEPGTLTTYGRSYLTNGTFTAFDGAAPNGWTLDGATASKDTRTGWFENNGYGIRVQATGAAASSIYQDLSSADLFAVRGKLVTLAVRFKVAGTQSGTAGRVQLQDGVTTYTTPGSSVTRDGFYWAVSQLQVDPAALFVRCRLYAEATATSTADVTFDTAHLVLGTLPRLAIGTTAGVVPNPPRSMSATTTASVDGTVAGDVAITATGDTVITPTGTPNGRMIVVAVLASGAQRVPSVATSVALLSGVASRSLTVPAGLVGYFGLRYSALGGKWYLMSADVATS